MSTIGELTEDLDGLVWRALADPVRRRILDDLLKDELTTGEDSLVSLEPKAGGRLHEQNGKRELLWYTVLAIDPGESLTMQGHISPDFGDPATTILTVKLKGEGMRTTLSLATPCMDRYLLDWPARYVPAGKSCLPMDSRPMSKPLHRIRLD
jgi:hypothetical protein